VKNRLQPKVAMKYLRFSAEKLVRDKTVERLTQKGAIPHYSPATDQQYLPFLLKKLSEEAEEVVQAKNKAELIYELADLLEVVHALCAASALTFNDIEQARIKKHAEWGGFEQRIICHYVDALEGSEPAEYYKAQPDKYPEINAEQE
jgi:predicted house-cleaning noncanonical NTP pyrophosphatase (MazG superfamily)